MKGFKTSLNTDRLIGLSAILISLLTLFIFFYQTNLIEEQSRLSVRPRLTFNKTIDKAIIKGDTATSSKITITLSVRNNGLGPAIIEESKIEFEGQLYDVNIFFDEIFPRLKDLGTFSRISDLNIGGAIPTSESINIISYEYDEKNEKEIMGYLNVSKPYDLPFRIRVEYSSLYEERWATTSNSEGHPKPLN